MKMADIKTGQTYLTDTGHTCTVLEKNVREDGYRGRPKTNVRVRWTANGVEATILARFLVQESE